MQIREHPSKPLPLTTAGGLELSFLGVGSAFTKRNYQTNLVICKGPDHLVVDFGNKAGQASYEVGRKVTDYRNFLITHSHADHVGGLEEVALSNRYLTKTRPMMYITARYQRLLWGSTLRGGCGLNEDPPLGFRDFFDVTRPVPLEGMPREAYHVQVGGISITMFRTGHIPEGASGWSESVWSSGIVIDERIMFTGDTRFDPELLESFDRIYRLETIFHDCQFFSGGVHAGFEELTTLPARIKKRILLVHYGDNWESFEPRIARAGFAGITRQQVTYCF